MFLFDRLQVWWRRWWTKRPIQEAAIVPEDRPRRSYIAEAPGSFSFKADLLDQLPTYFWMLNRMRRSDPESYDLYQQSGMLILPSDQGLFEVGTTLPPWWKDNRPSFGAFGLSVSAKREKEDQSKDRVTPRFMYFQKYASNKAPSEVQRARGDVYILTIYWDDGTRRGRGVSQFPFGLSTEGEITVLKTRQPGNTGVNRRTGRPYSNKLTGWGYDRFMSDYAREHKKDPREFAKELFVLAASGYLHAQMSVVQVKVNHKGATALFGIDAKRSAYFFKDRDVTAVTPTGQRKRIFHSVKAHYKRGTAVGLHFRGLRDFTWHGYELHITVPGKHHQLVPDLQAGAIDEERTNRPDLLVPMKELGRVIQRVQSQ